MVGGYFFEKSIQLISRGLKIIGTSRFSKSFANFLIRETGALQSNTDYKTNTNESNFFFSIALLNNNANFLELNII